MVFSLCQNFTVMFIVVFSLQGSKQSISKLQKQAKLLGICCIVRSGAAFTDTQLMIRLVKTVLENRSTSDREDMDMFAIRTALNCVCIFLVSTEYI